MKQAVFHKQSFRDVRELITSVVEENRPFGANGLPTGAVSCPHCPQAVSQAPTPVFPIKASQNPP